MRNAQILVMDEATASIDNKTDAMVQEMFAKHFAHCRVPRRKYYCLSKIKSVNYLQEG